MLFMFSLSYHRFSFRTGVATCIFLYIAEVCPAHLRSLHSSAATLSVGVGMMIVSVLSMYLTWHTIAAVMCAMCVAGACLLFRVPESPAWLRATGRIEEADRNDAWFDLKHISEPSVTVAPTVATNSACAAVIDGNSHGVTDGGKSVYWSLYLRRSVWKPTLIALALLLLQQFSGVYVLLFYSVDVLRDCKVPWDGITVSAFLSAARVLGALCFALLHRIKRRTLLTVSGGCMAASLLFVIAYMKTFERVQDPPFAITLIVAFVMFMFFALLGVMPIPWILCGEVFPTAVSGMTTGH